MADNFVQVPAQGVGLKVDTTELTVNAQTVERQRINIADPVNAAGLATITGQGSLNVAVNKLEDLMSRVITELTTIRIILAHISGVAGVQADEGLSSLDSGRKNFLTN